MSRLDDLAERLRGRVHATGSLDDLAERLRDACPLHTFEPTPSACDPFNYDTWIVAFSGGKDSLALVLVLLMLGIPKDRIELWHHDVDGREGSDLMDWPCTRDYCAKVAAALGIRIFFSWKVGGFEGEMLRKDSPTAGYLFETPDEGLQSAGGKSTKLGTRECFPRSITSSRCAGAAPTRRSWSWTRRCDSPASAGSGRSS